MPSSSIAIDCAEQRQIPPEDATLFPGSADGTRDYVDNRTLVSETSDAIKSLASLALSLPLCLMRELNYSACRVPLTRAPLLLQSLHLPPALSVSC